MAEDPDSVDLVILSGILGPIRIRSGFARWAGSRFIYSTDLDIDPSLTK